MRNRVRCELVSTIYLLEITHLIKKGKLNRMDYTIEFEEELDIEDYFLTCRVIIDEYVPEIGTECLEGTVDESLEELLGHKEFKALKEMFPEIWEQVEQKYTHLGE